MTDTIQRDASATGAFDRLLFPSAVQTSVDSFDALVKYNSRSGRRSAEYEAFALQTHGKRQSAGQAVDYAKAMRASKNRVRIATQSAGQYIPTSAERDVRESSTDRVRVAAANAVSASRDAAVASAALAMNRGYRTIWLVLSLLAMGWTWLSGLSLMLGVGIPKAVAVFGLAAMIALLVTTYVAGAPHKPRR